MQGVEGVAGVAPFGVAAHGSAPFLLVGGLFGVDVGGVDEDDRLGCPDRLAGGGEEEFGPLVRSVRQPLGVGEGRLGEGADDPGVDFSGRALGDALPGFPRSRRLIEIPFRYQSPQSSDTVMVGM